MLILIAEFRSYHLKPTPQALTGLFRIIKAFGMEGLPLQEWAYFSFPFSNVFNTGSTWASNIFLFPFSSFPCITAVMLPCAGAVVQTLLRGHFKLAACSFSSLTSKHKLPVHYNLPWKGVRAGKKQNILSWHLQRWLTWSCSAWAGHCGSACHRPAEPW